MTTQPASLLEIEHLTLAYGPVLALDDVSFEVGSGEVHAVLGEEGAGKTTLMKALGGYIPAADYSGEIRLAGQPLALRSIKDGLNHGIAIVPRKLMVFEHMSVAENVTMALGETRRRFTLSRRYIADEAARILETWEIAISPGADVRSLAPMQRRQIMLANALGIEPQLLVLDEPLAGMPDGRSVSGVVRLMRRMVERGITCLYLARRPGDATLVADCITVLRDGAVAGQWRRADFDENALVEAMASQRIYDPEAATQHEDFEGRRSVFDHWFKGMRK